MRGESIPSENVVIPEAAISEDTFELMTDSISNESDPLLQLDTIHDISEVLKDTHLSEEQAANLHSKLGAAMSKDTNMPLVDMSLEYLRECVAQDYLNNKDARAKINKFFIDDLQNQTRLREQYPALSGLDLIARFAPGIAYSLDDYHSMKDVALEGAKNTLSESEDYSQNPFIGLIKEDDNVPVWVLNFAHDVRFRGLIEDKLGFDLAEVPLNSQVQLLKYMTEADSGRFDKLCSTLNGIDEKLRLKLAENFIAADFGEDFGDSLLAIAGSEKLSNREKEQLFDTMSACRESITSVTGLYEGYDGGEFAREYRRAANERLTDAIAVFEKIARDGVAEADLDWAGQPNYDYAAAIEALGYEAKSLEIISGIR